MKPAALKTLMSSQVQTWRTPVEVLERVRDVGHIILDPCADDNKQFAIINFTKARNGLEQDWSFVERTNVVYVNPPYNQLKAWMAKLELEAKRGAQIIALVPSRTDTQWFKVMWRSRAICFWEGRLTFVGAPASAPFPSAIGYWGNQRNKFARAFADAGQVVFL